MLLIKKILNKFSYILIKILFRIIPKINRTALIKNTKKKGAICVVEEAYEFTIKEPIQKLAKKRFKNSVGTRYVDFFFGVKLKDVRLIGPFGIPVTRFGQIILEPISERRLFTVLQFTISYLGLFGFIKQYCLAIFPFFDTKKNFLNLGAYLICRGSRMIIKNNRLDISPVFGHWMCEQLPQLRGIEAVIKNNNFKECKLIINRSAPIWQIESLKLMGYDKKDITTMSLDGLRVGELVVGSLRNVHSKGMECDPKAKKWATKRLLSNYDSHKFDKQITKINICLFRQEEQTRRIDNIQDVRKCIESNNFTEIDLNNKNLFDSAKDFIYAENLLACYGSGISRIMFAKNLKKLIEIYSYEESASDVFFLLASEMGIQYKCIEATKLPKNNFFADKKLLYCSDRKKSEWNLSIDKLSLALKEKN